MVQLDNFSAWITVEGREVLEYNVEYSDDGLCASCYIASEAGKSFAIRWRDTVRSNDSMGRTYVDGIRCGVAKGINKKGYRSNPIHERDTACQNGVATSSTQARQLVFSHLSVTDDEVIVDSGGEPQLESELGIIRLEVSYVQRGDHARLKVIPFEPYQKVNERSRKGLPTQHQTKLGDSVTRQFSPVFSVKSFGVPRVFVFKYRPLHVLHAMDIIPKALSTQVVDLSVDSEGSEGNAVLIGGDENVEEEPNTEKRFQHRLQSGDTRATENADTHCEYDQTAKVIDAEPIEKENCEFPFKAEEFHSKDLVKKEIGDLQRVSLAKVEPEEAKPRIKTEPGTKVEVKTEDGSFFRIKKEEEHEVHGYLLKNTEAE